MSRWIYQADGPGTLGELNLELQPGDEFEAPDDWLPEPNPHPVYKPQAKPAPAKSAPAPAPEE